ncbi:lysylphosphatidylglycerol synthase domain-containing protein [Nonomuraea ferruginea]
MPCPPGGGGWRTAVRGGFLVVALGFGAWAVASRWEEVAAGFRQLTPGMVGASLAAVVAALLGAMLTWRTLLADLGSRLPVRSAAKVFFVGQLGKYIPGAVWPMLAQMEMGRDLGVPRARSAAAFFLMMPVQLASGLLVAFATLGWDRFGWLLLLVPALLVLLEPKVINAVIGYGLRRLKRPPLERPLTRKGMLAALGWAFAGWACYGIHLYFVAPQGGGGLRRRGVRAVVVPGHHDVRGARRGGSQGGGHGGCAGAGDAGRASHRGRAQLPRGDRAG